MSDETVELPTDEWIIVFYDTTCALRLYPTIEAARQNLHRTTFVSSVFRSPLDFQKRYDHTRLERMWEKLYDVHAWRWPKYAKGPGLSETDRIPPDCGTEAFTHELWKFMQRIGDRVIRLSVTQTRSKEHYEIHINKMKALIADEETFKKSYPKQCRTIIERMAEYDTPYVLEKELMRMMNALVVNGKLKTKQDSWLIFQFYRKQLMDAGLFSRGSEGLDEEEEMAA